MNNFDDWGTPNSDWGESESNNSDFKWDETQGEYGNVSGPSSTQKFLGQPLWMKLVVGVTAVAILGLIFIQVGGTTKLQSYGILREEVSPNAACINTGQVLAELAVGTFASQVLMDKALEHANRLKAQTSGRADIDDAMWSVTDAAYAANDAVQALAAGISSGEEMLGNIFDNVNSPEMQEAILKLEVATEKFSTACTQVESQSSVA